jgi:hypothetical protein
MPKRQTRNLSLAVEQRLTTYALAATAAGVGVLACAQPADAKIVYTPTHRKLPINQNFFIDFNHDGSDDLKFNAREKGGRHESDTTSTYASLLVYAYPSQGNAVVGKTFGSALVAGDRIGPKSPLNHDGRIGMGGVQTQSLGVNYWGPWANDGRAIKNRYLGVEFLIKGKAHFGWARFNVKIVDDDPATVNAVLTGYAYETLPNKAIVAGKTKGPDMITVEPSSLGALAAGAVAIPTTRQ